MFQRPRTSGLRHSDWITTQLLASRNSWLNGLKFHVGPNAQPLVQNLLLFFALIWNSARLMDNSSRRIGTSDVSGSFVKANSLHSSTGAACSYCKRTCSIKLTSFFVLHVDSVGRGESTCGDVDDRDESEAGLELHARSEGVHDDDEAVNGDQRQCQRGDVD